MRQFLLAAMIAASAVCSAQTFETRYERSVHDIMQDVQKRFGVKFKYNVDTVGMIGENSS